MIWIHVLLLPCFNDLIKATDTPQNLPGKVVTRHADGKSKSPECNISTQDWTHLEKPQEILKLWKKFLQMNTVDLTEEIPNHEEKIIEWIKTIVGNDIGKEFEIKKSDFYTLMESLNLSLEELRELNKPKCSTNSQEFRLPLSNQKSSECTTSTQDRTHLEKPQEILKLWEKFLQMNTLDLTNEIPNHKDKIIEWIKTITGNDIGKTFQLEKADFYTLMESLNLSLEELRELNKPKCSTSRPEFRLPLSEQEFEINKIWQKSLELKKLDLTIELPDHKDKIMKWIDNHSRNDKGETYRLPEQGLKHLLQSLKLSPQDLRDLYERLEKKIPRE